MDERLKGRWLSCKVVAAGQKATRAQTLVVKIISPHVVMVAEKENGKWITRRLTCNVKENRILEGYKCLFYILDITDECLILFSQDKWTVYEMERKAED